MLVYGVTPDATKNVLATAKDGAFFGNCVRRAGRKHNIFSSSTFKLQRLPVVILPPLKRCRCRPDVTPLHYYTPPLNSNMHYTHTPRPFVVCRESGCFRKLAGHVSATHNRATLNYVSLRDSLSLWRGALHGWPIRRSGRRSGVCGRAARRRWRCLGLSSRHKRSTTRVRIDRRLPSPTSQDGGRC